MRTILIGFDLLQATCSVTRECAISRGSFGLGRDCSFEIWPKTKPRHSLFFTTKPKLSVLSCSTVWHKLGQKFPTVWSTQTSRRRRLRPRGDGDGDRADAAVPCGAWRGPARDALHLLFPAQRNPELLAARLAHLIIKPGIYLCGRETRPRRPGNYEAAGPYVASVQRNPDRRTAGSDYGRSVRTPRPLSFCDQHLRRFYRTHGHAPHSYFQPLIISCPTQTFLVCTMSVPRTRSHAHARTRKTKH